MADAPESDQQTITKVNGDKSSSIFDSEIGDDWGEAFEADDFMLSSDEDIGNEFFLEENEFEDVQPSSATALDADAKPQSEGQSPENKSSWVSYLGYFLHPALPFLTTTRTFFFSLPLLYRIPLLFVVFLILLFPLTFIINKQPPPAIVVLPVPTEIVEIPTQTPEKIAELDALVSTQAPPEKTREKWHFPSFLISTSDDMKGDNIFFVEVDITFVLLLDAEEKLPTDKSIFVRDIIYQFFNNRPLYELRRYSLARGEMNRKLRAWVEKQWPEGNIASIIFNRYQII